MTITTRLLAVGLSILAIACDRPDPPAQTQNPAPPGPAQGPAAVQPPAELPEAVKRDVQEVAAFTLTMARMEKYFQAQKNLAILETQLSPAERAELERDSQASGSNNSLEDLVSSVERHPKVHDAVKRAGLSAREYALVTATYMQASMAHSVLQSRPSENQDSLMKAMRVHPANIAFIRQHGADVMRRSQAMEAEIKQMTGGQ